MQIFKTIAIIAVLPLVAAGCSGGSVAGNSGGEESDSIGTAAPPPVARPDDMSLRLPDEVSASNVKEAEDALVGMYRKEGRCGYALVEYVRENPYTIDYPFDRINAETNVSVYTSADGNLRLISWDTGNGGDSPDLTSYVQYRSGDKVKVDFFYPYISRCRYVCATDVEDAGFVTFEGRAVKSDIVQIDRECKSPVYVVTTYAKPSQTEVEENVYAIHESGGKLVKNEFIKWDGSVWYCGELYGNYSCFPRLRNGMWPWEIRTDSVSGTVRVPRPYEPESEKVIYDIYNYRDGKMQHSGLESARLGLNVHR